MRDVEANLPVEEDTIFRFYSMTKPVTSVALLLGSMNGASFNWITPSQPFIPEFKNLAVFAGGDANNYETVPVEREVTVRDLFTHTAGFTYGFLYDHPVDAIYRKEKVEDGTLKEMVQKLGQIPLLFSPGTPLELQRGDRYLGLSRGGDLR